MKELTQNIGRRQFLTGAATALGVAAVGVAPALAEAQARTIVKTTDLTVYYWNGDSFVRPTTLGSGLTDRSLVSCTFRSHGTSADIQSVNVSFPSMDFSALTTAPYGVSNTMLNLPVSPTAGLKIAIQGQGRNLFRCNLTPNGSGQGYLALGTYLVIHAMVPIDAIMLNASGHIAYRDGQSINITHVLIDVADV